MVDAELLITAVRNHPCLWDITLESYKDKTLKDNAWVDIAMEMYPSWEEFTDKVQQLKCNYILFTLIRLYHSYATTT